MSKARAVTKQEQEDVHLLQNFEGFSKFSEDDLKRIVQASHRTSTSGPWPLIREQTVSDACYILLSGEAAVYVGQDKIATVKSGEVIGESALKRGKLRGATVTTTGRAEVRSAPVTRWPSYSRTVRSRSPASGVRSRSSTAPCSASIVRSRREASLFADKPAARSAASETAFSVSGVSGSPTAARTRP